MKRADEEEDLSTSSYLGVAIIEYFCNAFNFWMCNFPIKPPCPSVGWSVGSVIIS